MKKLAMLQKPLTINQIDFRVQSINKRKINNEWYVIATVLAYKDARVDMERLDTVVGPLGWKREHLRDNHNCVVSIFNPETNEWVSKEDTGTESNAEAEKGLASDSFKRACFNWGIGRELYDYPSIQIELYDGEWWQPEGSKFLKQGNSFNLRDWKWYAEHDEDGKLSFLACQDTGGATRWFWGETLKQKERREKAEAKKAKEEAA